jgi:tRNA wybutosine-synthesizing protein 3
MSWNKKERMDSLEQKICEDEVDVAILPIVEAINAHPLYFTTSSCAGRIVLLRLPGLGNKEEAEFLAKWHRTVKIEEVKKALSNVGDEGLTFLLAQSPIIHVRCKDMKSAVELRNMAVESGLKYSTLKSLTLNSKKEPVKIVVEILSSENIHIPLARGSRVFPDDDYLEFMVENANSALERARGKLERFHENLVQISNSSMSLGK